LRIQLRKIDEERQRVLSQARDDAEKEIELLKSEVRRLRGRVVAAGESLDEVREIERELSSTQDFAEEERKIREVVATLRNEEPRNKSQEPRTKNQEDKDELGINLAGKSKIQNPKSKISMGDTVRVKALDSLATITNISDDSAEVQIGRMRMKVKLRDVERAKAPDIGPIDNSSKYERGHVEPSPGMELDMRGMMSEEGVERVQDYLDRASRAGLPFVRIIHGKGTGALRRAVRESIKDHSAVKSFETGLDGEGGDGVTVVKLHANG
jgi:DNA mismatch repair protein MutS2